MRGVAALFTLALGLTLAAPAVADPTPAPAASPSPTASPRPLGLRTSTNASFTFVDQSTAGDGQIAPEAPGFIAGSPLAPNTPYDLFSSAPQVPGVAGIGQITTTATYGFHAFDLSLNAG